MRDWINLIESADSIIPDERPGFNTLAKQLAAVENHGLSIQFIKNPSLAVQLAAVRENGDAIKHIKNPCLEVQLEAVQNYGGAIYYILDKGFVPSIALQRIAVLNDPTWALEGMIEHDFPISKMIQWTAAKRIKERNWKIDKDTLDKLDPDIQEYLRDNVS